MDSYIDWGEHLNAAPLAISVLGKLVVLTDQHRHHSHNKSSHPRNKLLAFYNYPKSIRNTFIQITRQGNLAFLKAHRNMENIRSRNTNVLSRYIKDTARYLMSRNQTLINQLLPISMSIIYDAAFQSKQLSNEVVKEFQILSESIEKLMMAIKQMELRRRKAQHVVVRNKSTLQNTKIYYKEAIKALKIASNELTKLKTAVTQLMTFYSKMSTFITDATLESVAFIFSIARDTNNMDDNKLFDKVQKVIESSYLVHEVTDMYVDVSEMYIIDQIGNLENVMKYLQANIVVDIKKEYGTWHIKSGSEGIRYYVEADEISLREKLVERHNEIVNEYRWIQDCDSNEDRQFV
jgi:hypothetical protein